MGRNKRYGGRTRFDRSLRMASVNCFVFPRNCDWFDLALLANKQFMNFSALNEEERSTFLKIFNNSFQYCIHSAASILFLGEK